MQYSQVPTELFEYFRDRVSNCVSRSLWSINIVNLQNVTAKHRQR